MVISGFDTLVLLDFSLYFSFFPVFFLVEDFLGREGCKELFFLVSLVMFVLWYFCWIFTWRISLRFWPVLVTTVFGQVLELVGIIWD
jgi:hypothetical protein